MQTEYVTPSHGQARGIHYLVLFLILGLYGIVLQGGLIHWAFSTFGQSTFWHDQVNECTVASQTLEHAALNANPPAQHVVTTVDGAVAGDSYAYPIANPSLAKRQQTEGQARWTANHCGDNPLIGIAVWANPEPDWNRARPA
jgi:hypothetical protein